MRNMTDINIVLDRSGSMGSCRESTIDSFNEFLKGQRSGPDEAVLSLYQFDHEYDTIYQGKKIEDAPVLTDVTYIPRGSTALLDAVGRTVVSVGERLSSMPECDRPCKVVVVIITDGEENASREFDRQRIFDMITHQKEKYSWVFVFMGANQDSYSEAGHMGFTKGNIMNYAHTAQGHQHSTQVMSRNLQTKVRGVAGPMGPCGACGPIGSSGTFFDADEQAEGDKMSGQTPNPTGGAAQNDLDILAKAVKHAYGHRRTRVAVKK